MLHTSISFLIPLNFVSILLPMNLTANSLTLSNVKVFSVQEERLSIGPIGRFVHYLPENAAEFTDPGFRRSQRQVSRWDLYSRLEDVSDR